MSIPKIEAAPGRVILKFPKPAEKIGSIIVAETSRRRPEFGELVSVGDPLTPEDRIAAQWIRESARQGRKFPVTIASGIGYWQEEFKNFGEDYSWLKDVRVYRITELATSVDGSESAEVEGAAV